jgi:hypothetical protein
MLQAMFRPSHLAPLTPRPGPGLRTNSTTHKSRTKTGWYGDIYSSHPAAARIDQVRRRCLLAEDDGRNQHGISSTSMHITDTSASASYSGISSTDTIRLPTRHFDSYFLLPRSFLSLSSPTALARVLCGLPRHRDYSKDHRHHCTSLLEVVLSSTFSASSFLSTFSLAILRSTTDVASVG